MTPNPSPPAPNPPAPPADTAETNNNTEATNKNTAAKLTNAEAAEKKAKADKKAADEAASAAAAINGETLTIEGLKLAIGSLIAVFASFSNKTEEQRLNLVGTAASAAFLTQSFFDATKSLNAFGDKEDGINTSTKAVTGAISEFAGKLNKELGEVIKKFGDSMIATNNFENGLLAATMAGGNFATAIGQNTENIASNMTSLAVEVAKESGSSALRLGVSYIEAQKRISESIAQLPEDFRKVYTAIDNVAGNPKAFTSMELISQAARGIGTSFKAGLAIAGSAMGNFGMDGEKAASRIALIGKASKDLTMPLEEVSGLLTGLDDTFKFWGSQMESSINVLGRISSALKDSGVGFKGQIELTKNLVAGLGSLDFGMKSFIAMSSGMRGAGGALGAGLQVEKLMQEGKMDEVVAMMQKTLEQKTGGRAISLNEATSTPGMERQFMVQREMLKNMSGIGDTGQLNRLLEAMSKGPLGGSGGGIDSGDALREALTGGQKITESQTDIASQTLAVNKNMFEALKSIDTAVTGRNMTGGGVKDQHGRDVSRESYFNEQADKVKTRMATGTTLGERERVGAFDASEASTRAFAGIPVAVAESFNRLLGGIESTPAIKQFLDDRHINIREQLSAIVGSIPGEVLEDAQAMSAGRKTTQRMTPEQEALSMRLAASANENVLRTDAMRSDQTAPSQPNRGSPLAAAVTSVANISAAQPAAAPSVVSLAIRFYNEAGETYTEVVDVLGRLVNNAKSKK
ncbi:MAG: hypothetical protein ACOYO1_04990 [Bacteroidales bacterium]